MAKQLARRAAARNTAGAGKAVAARDLFGNGEEKPPGAATGVSRPTN